MSSKSTDKLIDGFSENERQRIDRDERATKRSIDESSGVEDDGLRDLVLSMRNEMKEMRMALNERPMSNLLHGTATARPAQILFFLRLPISVESMLNHRM